MITMSDLGQSKTAWNWRIFLRTLTFLCLLKKIWKDMWVILENFIPVKAENAFSIIILWKSFTHYRQSCYIHVVMGSKGLWPKLWSSWLLVALYTCISILLIKYESCILFVGNIEWVLGFCKKTNLSQCWLYGAGSAFTWHSREFDMWSWWRRDSCVWGNYSHFFTKEMSLFTW